MAARCRVVERDGRVLIVRAVWQEHKSIASGTEDRAADIVGQFKHGNEAGVRDTPELGVRAAARQDDVRRPRMEEGGPSPRCGAAPGVARRSETNRVSTKALE